MLDDTPPVEGFDAIYGISAHTCPYCDGWEHGDERIAVYAAGEAAAHMGPLLRQWSADVIVVDPAEVARFVSPTAGSPTSSSPAATSIERDALFFHVAMRPRVDLAVQLGCALTEAGFVESAPRGPPTRSTASTPWATAPTRCSTCRCRSPTAPARRSSSTSACSNPPCAPHQ